MSVKIQDCVYSSLFPCQLVFPSSLLIYRDVSGMGDKLEPQREEAKSFKGYLVHLGRNIGAWMIIRRLGLQVGGGADRAWEHQTGCRVGAVVSKDAQELV